MATVLDCLKKIRIVDSDNTYQQENAENIARFLNRLLALEIQDQELMFNELDALMKTIIENEKEEGTYETGLEDIPISNMETLETHNIGTFTVHKISGKISANKTPFSVVEKHLLKETGKVYQCNATKTLFLARHGFNTYHFGSYERVFRLSSPFDYRHKTESATALKDTSQYTELYDFDLIQQLWETQYANAPREVTKDFYILTGSILDQWKIIKANLQKINIVRVGTGKNRIVGVLINEQTALSLLNANSSHKLKGTIYKKLFFNHEIITLNALNIKLYTRRIYGEKVISLSPITGEQDDMSISFIPTRFMKYLMVNGKLVTFIQKEYTDDFIELASKYYLSDINQNPQSTTTTQHPTPHKPLDLRPFRTQKTQKPNESQQPLNSKKQPIPFKTQPPKKIIFEEQLSLF